MKKLNRREFIHLGLMFLLLWGLFAPLVSMMVMSWVWFSAFLDPSHSVIIYIDLYCEAWWEAVVLSIGLLIASIGQVILFYLLR